MGAASRKKVENGLEVLEKHLQRRKAMRGRGAATRWRGSRQKKDKNEGEKKASRQTKPTKIHPSKFVARSEVQIWPCFPKKREEFPGTDEVGRGGADSLPNQPLGWDALLASNSQDHRESWRGGKDC